MAGSVFAGVVLAFLLVSFLLALYLSLTAMPEGESSYLVLEPRGLVVANGVVAFASTQGVGQHFARCSASGSGDVGLFLLFCLLACWLDALPALVVSLISRSNKVAPEGMQKRLSPGGAVVLQKSIRCLLLVVVAASPVYMVYGLRGGGGVPGTVMVSPHANMIVLQLLLTCVSAQIFSGVLAGASIVMGVLDIVLFAGRASTLEKGLELLQAEAAVVDGGPVPQDAAPAAGNLALPSAPPAAPESRAAMLGLGARAPGNRPRKQQAQEAPHFRQPPSLFLLHDPHELGYLPVASASQLEQKWHVA